MELLVNDGINIFIVGNEDGISVPHKIINGTVEIYGHVYELPITTRHYKSWMLRRIV